MELVQPLESSADASPLARARLHRQLTVEEAARRSGLAVDEARWLEEGRIYRFPSADAAAMAAVLYGSALGIDNREARELAGRPVPSAPADRNPLPRLIVLGAIVVGVAVLGALLIPRGGSHPRGAGVAPILPPPWKVDVAVLNGSGDINYTRQVASHVQAFGYTITHVGRADSFGYPQTSVYFPPGCDALALRLAKQIGVDTKPLPGGSGPCKLWVIVGPASGP